MVEKDYVPKVEEVQRDADLAWGRVRELTAENNRLWAALTKIAEAKLMHDIQAKNYGQSLTVDECEAVEIAKRR